MGLSLQVGGSFTETEHCARRRAPEFASGIAYSPFKLDFWQIGISLSDSKAKHSSMSLFCSSYFLA